jgi:hypothetical protein
MIKYLIKALGGIIILLGLYIGVHAVTVIGGWEHRNKVRLGIQDRLPYVELGVALCAVLIGLYVLLKKRKP